MKKRLGVWAIITASMLMIPLFAQWPWTGSDFVFGVIILFGSATVYELATRNMSDKYHRIIVSVLVAVTLLYLWAECAVGIFTNCGS